MEFLDGLRVCVSVANHQSFSRAADSLHIPPAMVSRAVLDMEKALKITLFYRKARPIRLTMEGEIYLERCQGILQELPKGRRNPAGEDAEPQGLLVVSAPIVFGRLHVLPIVSELLRAYPRLSVELTLSDEIVPLADEGVDVAVREGDFTDNALQAERVAQVSRVLVASPAYLAARGIPQELNDLRKHDLIDYKACSEWRSNATWRRAIRFEPRFKTNSVEAAVDAAIAGRGIVRPLLYQVEATVRRGQLVQVLPYIKATMTPINVVYELKSDKLPGVRAFVAAAHAHLAVHPVECSNSLINFQA